MVHRLKIVFSQLEYSGLLELAGAELRQPDSQVRHIIRRELKRHGLLSDEEEHQSGVNSQEVASDTHDE